MNKAARNKAPKTIKNTRKADGKVFVCLNQPHGIRFRLSGGREVLVEGNAVHLRGADMGKLPVGAYGMTLISATDWEEIKATYGHCMGIFKAGLIFASSDRDSAEDQAEEQAETRHGREPPPRGTGPRLPAGRRRMQDRPFREDLRGKTR